MNKAISERSRPQVLRATFIARRFATIGKVEQTGEGEVQFEAEEGLLRLEQELYDPTLRGQSNV